MGLWDFIKSKIFKKTTALPEAQIPVTQINNTYANSSDFDNRIKLDYTPKPKSIENALQQYVYSLLVQQESNGVFNSYRALTSLGGMDTSNKGNNLQNEEKFVSRLANDRNINMINQFAADKSVCFRHVQNGRDAKNTDMRLYINCKRENIAELANKFYEEFGNTPYYFKFCTDNQANNKRRSEQFVFYLSSEPKEMNRVVQTIERTRRKNPKLFEDSRNMNPFMKDINGYIGYAPDVNVDEFQTIDGKRKVLSARSYNTLLSEVLTDCFTGAIKDVVSHDYNLSLKIGGQSYDSPVPYVISSLREICENPEHQRKLIEKMKSNLEISAKRNPLLDIKGIGKGKETEKSALR